MRDFIADILESAARLARGNDRPKRHTGPPPPPTIRPMKRVWKYD